MSLSAREPYSAPFPVRVACKILLKFSSLDSVTLQEGHLIELMRFSSFQAWTGWKEKLLDFTFSIRTSQ